MTNNIKKKRKQYEVIGFEIEEQEKQYEAIVEEGKKIIELKDKAYYNIVNNATADNDKTKRDIIKEAGNFLARNQMKQMINKICARLKKDFKDVVKSPTYIQNCCPPAWRQTYDSSKAKTTKNKNKNISSRADLNKEQLTELEEKIVEFHEEKVHHNEHIEALINFWLGMTREEQSDLVGNLPKGTDKPQVLIDNAYKNMLKITKGLNDADIPALLYDIRILKRVLSRVAEIVLAEHESRKRNAEMTGK